MAQYFTGQWRQRLYASREKGSSRLGTEVEGPVVDVGGSDIELPKARLVSSTAERFSFRHRWLLDFIEQALEVTGKESWKLQRPALSSLIRSFFPENFNAPAWAVITPFKPRTNHAARGYKPADPMPKKFALGRRPPKFDFVGLPAVDRRGLHFTAAEQSSPGAEFFRLRRKRIVGDMEAFEEPLFLAHGDADRENLNKGFVPAQNDLFDQGSQVLHCPHVVLAKTDSWGRNVEQLNIGLTPGDALLTSLMTGFRPAEMYLQQHPVDRELLTEACRP